MGGTTQVLPSEQRGPAPFDAETVPAIAQFLSNQPYRRRTANLPRQLDRLDYDGYRKIRFDAAQAWWSDPDSPFRMQPHHRGFLFKDRVELFEVAEGQSTPIRFRPDQFRYEDVQGPADDEDIGFAGFRLLSPLNRPDHFDELCSFLGASYFRGLGRGNVYGLSARGLAIRTADPRGEEFPAFTAFWLEKPRAGDSAAIVHALLESQSLTGAYRIVITPGDTTVMEVKATLYPRQEVAGVGIAPATSMFFFGPQDRAEVADFRPAVHDSDGLLMRTGQGEQIWRPLANPRDLQVSGFQDRGPRGFGLLQRARQFASYQDLGAEYHRRPSLWTEPLGDWGAGEVRLVEIPTQSEIHDNIAAAWVPSAPLKAQEPFPLHYRLHWTGAACGDSRLPRFEETRVGVIGDGGRARIFVLELGAVQAGSADAAPEVAAETSAGELKNIVLQSNPQTGGMRLAFELHPGSARIAEIRARLMRGQIPVSESWAFRWTA
ncbi:glucan biosynthesis protein [Roseococcus sp. YIM B11640]|uniref:glucan biosynthesis protein n=1 Tax=Roseococcus sp. YIM B11640 TaxID=3133973 RepID=UPI003C7E8166